MCVRDFSRAASWQQGYDWFGRHRVRIEPRTPAGSFAPATFPTKGCDKIRRHTACAIPIPLEGENAKPTHESPAHQVRAHGRQAQNCGHTNKYFAHPVFSERAPDASENREICEDRKTGFPLSGFVNQAFPHAVECWKFPRISTIPTRETSAQSATRSTPASRIRGTAHPVEMNITLARATPRPNVPHTYRRRLHRREIRICVGGIGAWRRRSPNRRRATTWPRPLLAAPAKSAAPDLCTAIVTAGSKFRASEELLVRALFAQPALMEYEDAVACWMVLRRCAITWRCGLRASDRAPHGSNFGLRIDA